MARTYKRDSQGRFAGGGGGSTGSKPATVGRSGPRGGKVGTRTEQRRAAREQAARSAAFRGKATGSGRDARAAYRSAAGAARKARRQGPASGIRPTGGLPRPVTGNNIKRTTGPRRGPLAVKANNVRPYRAATVGGKFDQIDRKVDKAMKETIDVLSDLSKGSPKRRKLIEESKQLQRRSARLTARDIADAGKDGVRGKTARIVLSVTPGFLQRDARKVIRDRASRAAAVAARGRKVGAKALRVYDSQLIPTLSGKAGAGANNLKPGPRNTKGTPKPKRKRSPRKPKK